MTLHHSPSIVTSGLVLALDAANGKSYPGSGVTWTDLTCNNAGTFNSAPTYNSAIQGNLIINENKYVDIINTNLTGSSAVTFQTIFKWNSGNSVTTTTVAPFSCFSAGNLTNMQGSSTSAGFTWYNLAFTGTGGITPAAQLQLFAVPSMTAFSIDYTLANSAGLFISAEIRLTQNGALLDAVSAGNTSSGTFTFNYGDVVKIECYSLASTSVSTNQMSGSFARTGGGQCSQTPGDGMLFGYPSYAVWGSSGYIGFNTAGNDLYGISPTPAGLRDNYRNYAFVMARYPDAISNNKIYINGIRQTLSQIFGTPVIYNMSFNSIFRINGWPYGPTIGYGSYGMNSTMASFLAYNRELTSAEIMQNYNATKGRYNL